MARPRVLIEQWLPIDKIGAECMRERGASSALPPLYFLHVWCARRPLTVSRAAILASLLPAYPNGEDDIRPWPDTFRKQFPTVAHFQLPNPTVTTIPRKVCSWMPPGIGSDSPAA